MSDGAIKNSRGLTNKQEAFARAVITEDTLSDAYRSAYDCDDMKSETIHVKASELASNGKVAVRIAELRDRAEKAADVTLDRWLREQSRIAFADPKDLYDEDGKIKPLSQMSEDARATIAGLEVEYPSGEDAPVFVAKVKHHSKTQALESLGKVLGAYEKDNKQRNDIIPVLASKPDWLDDDET